MLKNNLISLRLVEPSDLEQLLNWENNSDYWEVSHTLVPFTREVMNQYVHAAQDIFSVKQVRLIIERNTDQALVGAIDLFDFNPKHQFASVGILIDGNFRNQGYAAAALEQLKYYAMQVIGIRNLQATILADNIASIHLFEKCGFERCGAREKWFNRGGEWIDEVIYQCRLTQ